MRKSQPHHPDRDSQHESSSPRDGGWGWFLSDWKVYPRLVTWKPHRSKNPRNCDQCPPRHPAIWILHQPGVPAMYLCVDHADRMAETYGLVKAPALTATSLE